VASWARTVDTQPDFDTTIARRNVRRLVPVLATAITALVATAPLTGAASEPSSAQVAAASAFMKKVARTRANGQTAKSYASLYPGQKQQISRSEFAECAPSDSGITITGWKVEDATSERVEVPGTGAKVDTVTSTVVLSAKRGDDEQSTTTTVHAIKRGKKWTWALSPTQAALCGLDVDPAG
jgi:hypothetical protein